MTRVRRPTATAALRRSRIPLILALSAALALLGSGCLWGVIRDADTGQGIQGATVTVTDSKGAVHTATTDANGIYAFSIADGPVPASGAASFEIVAPSYQSLFLPRLLSYDDNPGAKLPNITSFWEVQSFDLLPKTGQQMSADLAVTDIYADNLPQGQVYVRITNNGPDDLDGVSGDLTCTSTATPVCLIGTPGCFPVTFVSLNMLTINLDTGNTKIYDTGFSINAAGQMYDIDCGIQTDIADPDPFNNSYSQSIVWP